MSASLVGSEMCIRDSGETARMAESHRGAGSGGGAVGETHGVRGRTAESPVSYTHLTLPTICSV
eukprot:7330542-Alexandrium_andersonii.AAC.1